jgi:hypothetical protein
MATKTATVNASLVPSTQTDFPSYVDLSRLGITTLAEAQSVRVYSNAGLTTELARQIVSATEMHVKIPSLTTTFQIWVDYDGVRADYAATDTFGSQAAWSATRASYRLNESSGNASDATSGAYTLTNTNTVTYGSAYIGNGATSGTGNTDKRLTNTNALGFTTDTFSMYGWYKSNTAIGSGVEDSIMSMAITAIDRCYEIYYGNISGTRQIIARCLVPSVAFYSTSYAIDIGTTTWVHVGLTINGSTLRLYVNGVDRGNVAVSGAGGRNMLNEFSLFCFGQDSPSTRVSFADGTADEVQVVPSVVSADWMTTIYNNQSNESSFWGTWTDAGGGAAPTPLLSLMGIGS